MLPLRKAGLQIRASHVFVKKSGIEAVACTDGVYRNNFFGRTVKRSAPR